MMNAVVALCWICLFYEMVVGGAVPPLAKPIDRHRAKVAEQKLLQKLEEDEYQRDLYRQKAKEAQDRYYDQYFERMKNYGAQVQKERYQALLRRQETERESMAKAMKQYGVSPDDFSSAASWARDKEKRPASPFGELVSLENIERKSRLKSSDGANLLESRNVGPVSRTASKPENNELYEKILALRELCMRFLTTVRKHCVGERTEKQYVKRCEGYFSVCSNGNVQLGSNCRAMNLEDCQSFLPRSDPLYSIANTFTSKVSMSTGTVEVNGIPYYPINEEGSVVTGHRINIPFGTWGGGWSFNRGVRDFWSQTPEAGANWYEGKYGYKFGWSVPLVQSLGVEGDTHALVSVPIKQGELGKPIGVDVGLGVGPYYQQNQHVGVDWMNGQVGTNFGIGVPFAGVGFNTGTGVVFPSVNTFAGYG